MKLTSVSWILVVAACGGGAAKPEPTTPEPATPPVATAPVASEHCYAGNGAVSLPNGQVVATFEAVARRKVDPATATITEMVAVGGERPSRYSVTIAVDGAKFTMKEDHGAFTGDGDLSVGEPWAWTEWTSRSTMPEGTVVTSTDKVDGEHLTADKTVTSNGSTLVTIHEDFTEIPCAEFESRAEAIAPSNEG